MPQLDVVGGSGSGLKSNGLGHNHKGHSLGFGLAHLFVVRVRRSPRCNISCAISCTSVENSSAGCIPVSRVILPPKDKPLAGAIRSE